MWGRATLTMVASRTTMSWAVRITSRNTEGLASDAGRPGAAGGRPAGRVGARSEDWGDGAWCCDLSAVIVGG